ncbi:MAG: hypothetical protein GSR81_02865 [Desulfurococcales archaeon]|nr:hypothetical protein [Desulfurococcales archaeon]
MRLYASLVLLFVSLLIIPTVASAGSMLSDTFYLPATVIVANPPNPSYTIMLLGLNGYVFQVNVSGNMAVASVVLYQNGSVVNISQIKTFSVAERYYIQVYSDVVSIGSYKFLLPMQNPTVLGIEYNGTAPSVQIIAHNSNGEINITAIDVGEYRQENGTLDRLKDLAGGFLEFFQLIGAGITAFFSIVYYSIDVIWNVARIMFYYASIALSIFRQYVLPNLTLALGLYFLVTVGDMVRKLPREGLDAVVDWGRLWYGHVMAIVRFFEWMFQTTVKIINTIANIIEAIWPL